MVGSLELFVGGMFADKSTELIRQGKRHIYAGRKVTFLKPEIDNRYSESEVVTHDGVSYKAKNVWFNYENDVVEPLDIYPEIIESDVICIDEIQFFPPMMIEIIEKLIYSGKKVYAAGLDMDRTGKPFGIVPYLMAKAEKVTKLNAVCSYCGGEAWVTLGRPSLTNNEQVNVGNEYIPACRSCADKHGGVR